MEFLWGQSRYYLYHVLKGKIVQFLVCLAFMDLYINRLRTLALNEISLCGPRLK